MVNRGLSSEFMKELKAGILQPILEQVQRDNTLDLQIRKDEVHIYYRGGKILGIKPNGILTGCIKFDSFFDIKYSQTSEDNALISRLPKCINSKTDAETWAINLPFIKRVMDYYFTKVSKKNEREFQQLVVRENNYSNISNSTDYFIVDIEYAIPAFDARFDLIAIKWESKGSKRTQSGVDKHPPRVVFIEKKYADGALGGNSGLKKHILDIEEFLKNSNNLKTLKEEIICIFKQKNELDLICFGSGGNTNTINKLADDKPELILLLANHDPESSKLRTEFESLPSAQKIELKVAVANFMGYGLYDENVYPIEEFCDKFKKQIYSGGKT